MDHFSKTIWFPGYEINFAQNLLRKFNSDLGKIAIHFQPEKETIEPSNLTRQEVLNEVFQLQNFFIKSNVSKGDRIAGILPNSPESILGMLATTSLGGIWTSASPDFGTKGILDRFSQIEPKVLILSDGYFFKGKIISCLDKWIEVLNSLPSVQTVLVWNFTQPNSLEHLESIESWCKKNNRSFQNWSLLRSTNTKDTTLDEIQFTPISFQDPVYIMYSSGTTGLPKCIVQGAGVLVNHIKELIVHSDLRETESITYYTTCGWMMWNWVASSLFVGSRLCIYDGNPFYPDWKFLWNWIDKEKIQVFGTSAKYLTVLSEEKAQPGKEFQLSSLRCILSTGSPLPISTFHYVYDSIKNDLQLSSISGGTDLNGCLL
jgi:acetoacetyl-CoA synthetase